MSFLKTPEERVDFYKSNDLDPSFVKPEEAGLIADKQPIVVVDTSGSMETIVTKTGLDGAPLAPEPRFKEQRASGMQLLTMLNAFSKQPTRLYDLKGGQVNEASPDDPATRRLFETIGGGTPLAATLKKIESDLKNEKSNKRVVIYVSTDGDATDVTDNWGYFDKAASRLAFETQLRHMIDDGIVSDDEAYRRAVYVSIQYVGDDDAPFDYPPVPPGLSEKEANQFLLDAVRREGSAGAYYAALDDDKRGGIKNLDVFDDIGAEMRDARRAGYEPTLGDLTLKKMVGPLVPRLDNLNEARL
ncbi:MAG: VWA domain-containing protein [Paraburkholderia sp.]|nr:MAG: VWA domain-containing protein [Paraburkholderia sp.]